MAEQLEEANFTLKVDLALPNVDILLLDELESNLMIRD
jgi:hypothetical protein